MRRNVIALGASVIALALTAGPANAAPDATQAVDDSAGTAQVGPAAVDAPVRVLSDGESAATGVSAGAPQTTGESTGAAQAGAVEADAPVRVLSDGDDSGTAAGDSASAPDQSTSDTTGAAQVGSAGAEAPVRVLSDGDNGDEAASADAPQSAGESTGSAQVGATGLDAPVRVASDGDDDDGGGQAAASGPQTAGDSTGTAQVGSPGVFAPVGLLTNLEPGEAPGAEDDVGDVEEAVGDLVGSLAGLPRLAGPSSAGDGEAGRLVGAPGALGGGPGDPRGFRRIVDNGSSTVTQPAVDLVTGGTADAGEVHTLGVQAGSLPLTGLGVLVLFVLGLWMLSSGLALRLVPGGTRR